MKIEKVVFLGSCQAAALGAVYEQHIGRPEGQTVTHLTFAQPLEARSAAIAQADMICAQVVDFRSRLTAADLRPGVRLFEFPWVTGGFLWPFANQAHPKNEHEPNFHGAYPAELGDSFLNKMIINDVPPGQAVEQYIGLDILTQVNLDRLFELHMDRQRRRDEQTGFELASIIESHFQNEALFRSPGHPNMRIFSALFSQFSAKIGIAKQKVDRILGSLTDSPFPPDQLPLHPSVIRHFGLQFADETTRYRFNDEGSFTFSEFALRYMMFEYNEALRRGIWQARVGGSSDEAVAMLRKGLQKTPRSAEGHHSLSVMLGRRGELEDAVASARRALGLDRQEPRFRTQLADVLAQLRDESQAESLLREAVADGTANAAVYECLGKLLLGQGRADEGFNAIRTAIELDGSNPHLRAHFANQIIHHGHVAEAEKQARAAIGLDPTVGIFHLILARALTVEGHVDQAAKALQNAIRLSPPNVSYHTELCRLFLRQGRVADAITALRRAIEINDKNGHIWAHMGNLLASQGALDEAEEALRHAIKLHPAVAGFHAGLARVLNRLERQDDALNAAKAAVELAPNDQAHRRFYDDLVTRFGARPLLTTANAGTVAPPRTNNVPPRSSDRVYADAINEVSDYSHIQHAAC